MDFDFAEPTLDAKRLLFGVRQKKIGEDELFEYLRSRGMVYILQDYMNKGYIRERDISHLYREAEAVSKRLKEKEEKEATYEELKEEATHFAKMCDIEGFRNRIKRVFEKNSSLNIKFDAFLCKIRILLLLERRTEVEAEMRQTRDVIELGVDWARKNKFKVYEGLHFMNAKRHAEAISLFLPSLSTFEGEELVTYRELVLYTVFTGGLTMERTALDKELINSSEILEVIREIPLAHEFLSTFFECDYGGFMSALLGFTASLEKDQYLKEQVDSFVYRMKARAYSQLFLSYNSISLVQMAEIFGVRANYIEKDAVAMILKGDLSCVINRENMIIYNVTKAEKESAEIMGLADTLTSRIQRSIK